MYPIWYSSSPIGRQRILCVKGYHGLKICFITELLFLALGPPVTPLIELTKYYWWMKKGTTGSIMVSVYPFNFADLNSRSTYSFFAGERWQTKRGVCPHLKHYFGTCVHIKRETNKVKPILILEQSCKTSIWAPFDRFTRQDFQFCEIINSLKRFRDWISISIVCSSLVRTNKLPREDQKFWLQNVWAETPNKLSNKN